MVATPQLLKEIVLTIDTEDFSQDVLDAQVVPTAGAVQTARTLDGHVHQDAEGESWALELRCVIDWDSTRPGLAHYLMANKGTQQAFVFKDDTSANSVTKPAMTGTLTCVPLPYGGAGNVYAEGTVLLPIDGDPVPDSTP